MMNDEKLMEVGWGMKMMKWIGSVLRSSCMIIFMAHVCFAAPSPKPTSIAPPFNKKHLYYISETGCLCRTGLDGRQRSLIMDPGTQDGWEVVDFDVTQDGRKAIVVINHISSDRKKVRSSLAHAEFILDLVKGDKKPLKLHAEVVRYIFHPKMRWAPDGRCLAYISGGEIWLWDSQTSSSRVLSHLMVQDTSPPSGSRWTRVVKDFAWFPDGRHIAAWIGRLSGSGIAHVSIVEVSTGNGIKVSDSECYNPTPTSQSDLSWVHRDNAVLNNNTIHVYTLSDEKLTILSAPPANWFAPMAWSPDDQCIAYSGLKNLQENFLIRDVLVLFNVRSHQILAEIPSGVYPGWANSRRMIYQSASDIWSFDLDHSTSTKLLKGSLPESGNFLAP